MIIGAEPDSNNENIRWRRRTKMKLAAFKKIPAEHLPERLARGTCVWLSLILAVLVLSACYYPPYNAVSQPAPEASQRVPSTQVFFYPNQGQTTEQQSRDHYDCYNWAINQTGFDPGQSAIPTDQRVRVVPIPPPGHDTATLSVVGAVLGALLGGRRHAVGGAIIGATGGAIAGAASDSARQEYARQLEEAYSTRDRSRDARLDERAIGFRRAMSACLEGRGYTVK
jgi:hypothetical protein